MVKVLFRRPCHVPPCLINGEGGSSYLPSIYSTVINRANKAPHPLLVSLSFLPPKN